MRLLPKLFLTYAFLAASCAALLAADQQPFYLHSGDTVVFYGDSITDQRLYTAVTELYTLTRYPQLKVTFVHSGWGGDRVTGGGGGPIDVRLQRDVFVYKPTVMTIMLGMNDGHYVQHAAPDDEVYYNGYKHIIESVRQTLPGIRITAIEPSPFDDVTRPITLQPDGYNAVLVKYSSWIHNYANQSGLACADFNAPVVDMLKRANTADPAVAQKILPDRVHPSLSGHLIMAEQLLKTWNARPTVASVTIDAEHGKVAESDFTRITDLHAGAPLVWTELDESLPMPFAQMLAADRDGTLALAIHSSDVTEALNQEPLRVSGLKSGRYKLTIDGEAVGSWSDVELANGVNLALLKTPMSQQASEVRDWTQRHMEIHQFRWRVLQVPLGAENIEYLNETMNNLDSIEAQVVTKQRAAAQPRPHVFQLSPAT
jgi:lysophospholipase L1-like esterase